MTEGGGGQGWRKEERWQGAAARSAAGAAACGYMGVRPFLFLSL
jgi:hypothetical protein